ncbi:nuclear transport factor 2 family protein [Pseudomonas sp. R5(2019)]|uniref:nuclear transport factor 2 family protein n=1 Tax=Pseudomonas sp. R5(2019) TaxID=2697566 RepID=UPI0014134658|nr:nuclear transport factor 2 family protein [Pseudomonas sp. R5(2019)]NBA97581.1 hypothetical protein [Pseudomonas sp. R5(2019)]
MGQSFADTAALEILHLLHQYSWGYDIHDMALLGSVFSDHARTGGVVANTDIGWGPWVGRDNIVNELSAIRCSQSDRRRHVITSSLFEALSQQQATVRVYLSLFSFGDGQPPHLVTTGEYVMEASRHDGRWLIDVLEEVLESAF